MKKKNKSTIIILSIFLAFICGSLGSYVILINTDIGQNIIKNVSKSDYTENSLSEAVNKIYDATVLIQAYKEGTLISTGTGFVYKQDKDYSYIMTNNHVVSESDELKLVISNNEEIEATLKSGETYSDIAVIVTTNTKDLKVAVIGNNELTNVGDTVFTIGSPQGVEYFGTVTKGIISGKDRLVPVSYNNSTVSDYYIKVLQTDAAINPGNSGGPICNINGEVIGITNMKLVSDTVEKMGFAIPIEDAMHYAEILETGKTIKRPLLGISMIDVTNETYLYQNNISIPNGVEEGVVVIEVQEDSPASKVGLKKGDIILSLAKEDISSVAELRYILYKHEVGEEIQIQYLRNGKVKTSTLILTENNN